VKDASSKLRRWIVASRRADSASRVDFRVRRASRFDSSVVRRVDVAFTWEVRLFIVSVRVRR